MTIQQIKPRALVFALVGGILFAWATVAQAIEFNEVARFNVSFAFNSDLDPDDSSVDDNPKFIGTNPLGVAWNGSKLYLAGFDNFGSSLLPVGLIEVLNATRTGEVALTDADFSDAFGQKFQPSGRGYTGIELSGDSLAAAYGAGSATPDGIQVFNTSDNSLRWDIGGANPGTTARGGSGVAFDPGFNGDPALGGGVAWTTFGSGRRALQDPETGVTEYDLTTGFQWIADETPPDNFARDMAFDPETGDVYVRRSNDIDVAIRTGENATTGRVTLIDGADGPFVLGHKIEFLNNTSDGDLLIYNDRPASGSPPAFVDAVKVIDTAGNPQAATYNLLGGLTGADIGDSAAIYDFDYDEASNTLAILDFQNRNVFIFEVGAATAGLTGDYNRDGIVNAADYTVWRDSLGENVANDGDGADGNGNGVIDQDDYDQWANNYGATGPSNTAVPEPTTLVLLSIAGFGLASRIR